MKTQRSRSQAPPLVLLLLLSCTLGLSDSNTTPESNFQTSTYSAAKASGVDVHPFTDVPLLNSAIKSPSVDVTRNPNVLSVSQITSSSGVTSLTTTETLPSSSLPSSSASSSSSSSSSSPTIAAATATAGTGAEVGGEITPEVVVPSVLPIESSSGSSSSSSSSSSMGSDSISISVPHTIAVSTSVPSTDPLEAREPISNQPETDQENTDERPPASSSVGEAEITPETPSVIPMTALPSVQSAAASVSATNSIPTRTMNQTLQPSSMTTTHETLINDVHVEKKLENGLYRIKLAEIITDQFNGGINQQQQQQQLDGGGTEERYPNGQPSLSAGKINIADLYPLKVEDFNPIIRNSNEKLIREKSIYFKDSSLGQPDENDDRNMLPNALDALFETEVNTPSEHSVNSRRQDAGEPRAAPVNRQRGEITDFTGKLLQEKDGVITEIEKKFRLDEFEQSTKPPAASKHPATTARPPKPKLTVNHQIEFIDRRVKKSFEFPLHRTPEAARIGFANTKFKSDTAKLETGESRLSDAHPEFSTTKFYNSKELYNEMLQRKRSSAVLTTTSPPAAAHANAPTQPPTPTGSQLIGRTPATATATSPDSAAGTPATGARTKTLKRVKVALQRSNGPQVALPLERGKKLPADTRTNERKLYPSSQSVLNSKFDTETRSPTTPPPPTGSTSEESTAAPTTTSGSIGIGISTSTSTGTPWQSSSSTPSSSSPPSSSSFSASSSPSSSSSTPNPVDNRSTSPTKKTKSKPISRPRILSRLQEKINSLECDIQILPQESHIWRGNETHELMLPIVTPESCKSNNDCTPMVISWEGDAEIQSGDVLLVEINDAMLYPNYQNKMNSGHTTQVYQVTRSGHEHCDVTEGILLDITPLVVDGRKLVTLYDKDLTEGINLLIVVSELWGAQCIRLKVTMKSDNCGENADCSGKGVCYSNESMEGYECQCCGGFAGPHCEEIDACSPSPCTNNGICVDLSQGHEGNAYQCLCPYGYTGKNCQYESDPCNPAECMNGGSCVGNASHFRCDCAPGYTGPLCQHNLNECESSPCVHGICVDQEDGFRCFCQPGFAGELCNFEYNECESNPCLNGAECIDQIGSFECRCSKGYIGSRCEIKVDFCANKPCPEGHRCIDHGDDFSCECPGGRNGPDCNQIPRTQCNVNPCTHGGTCWSSGDSFYCACRPGYTGTMCEDEFVVETVVSSSEFMVDDTSARNFNDKAFGSVVLKSPIELHNAYIAAGVLAAAIFIVAVVVTICHCKVNQTYRKFSTRSTSFFPIIGFGRRGKAQKSHKHWLSGKAGNGNATSSNPLKSGRGHVPGTGSNQYHSHSTTGLHQPPQQVHERPFQRHLAMNLENDMYYTVDFSEHSQHSPLIQ